MIRVADPFKQGSVSQWDGNSEPTQLTGTGTVQMEPGKILRLTQGEDVTFSPGTNRPNGAFLNLVQTMIREMSMGMNMPYGFLYDMSTFGGHASRIEIAQAQRGIRRFQKLLKEQALDPVRNAVLGMGISEGIIPPHPAWKNGRWGFGASLSGDYGNDTAANLQKLSAGLITASDLISENGQTFEEVTRRQATEIQYMQRDASETGVPIELLTTRLSGATELLAAMNTPPPAPPAGLVEAGTDVKPMIDILKNVGEGVMDRESAIMALVQMYGLSRQEADKIVPDYNPPEAIAVPAAASKSLQPPQDEGYRNAGLVYIVALMSSSTTIPKESVDTSILRVEEGSHSPQKKSLRQQVWEQSLESSSNHIDQWAMENREPTGQESLASILLPKWLVRLFGVTR